MADPTRERTFGVVVESSTHADLQQGRTCTQVSRAFVAARDEVEAMCVAAQMAACRGRVPTQTTPEI